MPKFRSILGAVLVVATICYPFLVYFGLAHVGPRLLALLILIAATARLALFRIRGGAVNVAVPTILAASVLSGIVVFSGEASFLLYYPVLVNFALLGLFCTSLIRPPSIVERIARLHNPNLSARAIAYTRRVTAAWSLFFLVNGGISLATVLYGDLRLWTLYNGIWSYIAIGLFAAAELLVRRRIQQAPAAT